LHSSRCGNNTQQTVSIKTQSDKWAIFWQERPVGHFIVFATDARACLMTTTQPQTQYAIKDDNATSPLVNPRNTLVNQTLSNNPDGTATRLTSGNAVNFYTGRGWYVDFPDSGGP